MRRSRNAVKAKQKRSDLRLVGLGLVVTRDGGIPIVSHAYGGDRPDVTQFSAVVDELLARYRELTARVESLTVVHDAGQNSCDNHTVVEDAGIGFVGSLPPSDHPDLLAIPRTPYSPVDEDRFLVDDDLFDRAYARIRDRGIEHWADPHLKRPGETNTEHGGRGVYFNDPSGHGIEMITRPYLSAGVAGRH